MVRPVDRVLKAYLHFAVARVRLPFPWSDPWIGY